jgi:hypothetical protein
MSDKVNPKDFELKKEDKDDFKQSVIERKNVKTEFTLSLVEEHKNDLLKLETELTAQASVCQATVDNIERNHEFAAKLTDEERHHVWMYVENATVVKDAEAKLKVVKEQLGAYDELLDTVYEKFGFVKTEVEEPKKPAPKKVNHESS